MLSWFIESRVGRIFGPLWDTGVEQALVTKMQDETTAMAIVAIAALRNAQHGIRQAVCRLERYRMLNSPALEERPQDIEHAGGGATSKEDL